MLGQNTELKEMSFMILTMEDNTLVRKIEPTQ